MQSRDVALSVGGLKLEIREAYQTDVVVQLCEKFVRGITGRIKACARVKRDFTRYKVSNVLSCGRALL